MYITTVEMLERLKEHFKRFNLPKRWTRITSDVLIRICDRRKAEYPDVYRRDKKKKKRAYTWHETKTVLAVEDEIYGQQGEPYKDFIKYYLRKREAEKQR